MAALLKGAPVAKAITAELVERAQKLESLGVVPTLAIMRVGEREDDLSYERRALKRCEKVGISCRRYLLPADVSQEELLRVVAEVNEDPSIHGCLIFRPLPAHLKEDMVAAALLPKKDVDSMTSASLLSTLSGLGAGYAPCTAEAVLAILDHYGIDLDGANVVVVGRSLVIGKPVASMLLARNATVTTCHMHHKGFGRCVPSSGCCRCRCGSCPHAGSGCGAPGPNHYRCGNQLGCTGQKTCGRC